MDPGIFFAIIAAIATIPTSAQSSPEVCVQEAVSSNPTNVTPLFTIIPVSSRPMIAKNIPIPAPVAIFKS